MNRDTRDWPAHCDAEGCTDAPIVGYAYGGTILYLCGIHFGQRLAGIRAMIERLKELPKVVAE